MKIDKALDEISVKNLFKELTMDYLDKKITKSEYAKKTGELLYHQVLLKNIVIKELMLFNFLEKAADLDFQDNNFENEVKEYFSIN